MITLMDHFFIRIGFQEDELKRSAIRGWLYMGMIYMIGLTTAFLIMALIG